MDETKKWTNLTCAKIGCLLAEEGFKVSRNVVRKLLKKNDYVKRKALKKKAAGGHVNRNSQFERIAELRDLYTAKRNPILSVDSKKKRGVAIFAIDFSGRPARKISKNHATAYAFGCPDSSCFARFDPTRGRNIATQ